MAKRNNYHTQEWWKQEMKPAKLHDKYLREVASMRTMGQPRAEKKRVTRQIMEDDYFARMDREYEASKKNKSKGQFMDMSEDELDAFVDDLMYGTNKKEKNNETQE